MKKQLLFILIILLSINCYSQISFEKGYYINNSNQKVECLIKNNDWKNNPTEFEYKLTESSDKKKATIKSVKEFGIYNISKYARHTVKMDIASNEIYDISYKKNVTLKEKEVFLKVLVEGDASLYSFENRTTVRFFYNKVGLKVEQLIYKRYLNSHTEVAENNRYKQQLWNDLKCSAIELNKVENLNYEKNKLIRFFVEYNECNNQEYTNFEEKEKRDLFNLSIRPGYNSSSLSIRNNNSSIRNTKFDNESTFRFGIEAEFIMPFNNNKWSIIFEPTYQYYKSEKELAPQGILPSQLVKVDYTSIEFPVGVRYYLFLDENSKIFINTSFIFDVVGDSVIDFEYPSNLDISSKVNMGFGLGYKLEDRYSMELRYLTERNVLNEYLSWKSSYNTFSVIFGYSLF